MTGIFLGIILIPFLTKFLTKYELGIYSLILGYQLIASNFITLQLFQPINVLYHEKKFLKTEVISQSLITLFLISSILLSISFVLLEPLVSIYDETYTLYIFEFKLMLFSAYLMGFKSFFDHILRAQKKSKSLFILVFFPELIAIIFKIFLLKNGGGIASLFFVICITHLITIIFQILLNHKFLKIFRFRKKILKSSFNYALPLIPYSLASSIIILSDRILLEKFFSVELLGIYFVAFKFSSIGKFIANQITVSYQTFFYEKANKYSNLEAINSAESFSYFKIIFITLFLISINLFSIEIFKFFTNKNFHGAYEIFLILNCSYYFRSLYNLKSLGLFLMKKTNIISVISITTGFLVIILNLVSSKYLNYNSIPIMFVFSQILPYLLIEFKFDKIFNIKINKQLFLVTLSMIILSYIPYLNLFENALSLYFRSIIFIIILLIILITFSEKLKQKLTMI